MKYIYILCYVYIYILHLCWASLAFSQGYVALDPYGPMDLDQADQALGLCHPPSVPWKGLDLCHRIWSPMHWIVVYLLYNDPYNTWQSLTQFQLQSKNGYKTNVLSSHIIDQPLAEVDRLPAFWPTSAQHLSWTWIARGATRLTQDLIGNYRTEGYWPEQKQWWNIFRAFNLMTNTASWSWTMNPQHLRNSYKLCALTSTMQRHHAPPPISCQSLPKWRLQSRLSSSCSDDASWVKLLWVTTLAPEVHLGTLWYPEIAA